MLCDKCKKSIPEESVFCNFCGHPIKSDINTSDDLSEVGNSTKRNKKLIYGVAAAILIITIVLMSFVNSNPTNKALQALSNKNFDKLNDIYNKDIKGNEENQREFSERIELKLDDILNDFKNKKLDFEEVNDSLDELLKFNILKSKVNDFKKVISDINDSRINFSSAVEFENQGDHAKSISRYKNVIDIDEDNYKIAKTKITDLSKEYKQDILVKIEEFEKKNDYNQALNLLSEATSILNKDNDIETKKIIITEKHEKQIELERKEKAEKAKNEQIIVVDKTGILIQSTSHKTLYPDMFEVVIKNNAEETIKYYEVAMLGWDKNGYPLKIKQSFLDSDGSYQFFGKADNVNVIKGNTFGKNTGWSLEEGHNISNTKAIVIEAEFYDGSVWKNPYYEFFLEKYEGKPLNE